MNILVRADSSSVIGAGHIMRDLFLGKSFREETVRFASRTLPGNINERILEAGYGVITLETNRIDELAAVIKKEEIDLLVVDHYGIDANDEKLLKEQTGVKIMALDDTYVPHRCDILLNPNIHKRTKINNITNSAF